MGARLLKNWLIRPLRKLDLIQKRLECVEELHGNKKLRKNLFPLLKNVGDLERLISKTATSRAVARDLVNLKYSLRNVALIKKELIDARAVTLREIGTRLKELKELDELIDSSINEDQSLHSETRGIVKSG